VVVSSCSRTILISSHSTALSVLDSWVVVYLSLSTVRIVAGSQTGTIHRLVVDYLEVGGLLSLVHFMELALKYILSGRRSDTQGYSQELVSSSGLHVLLVQ
jgi:hypothetical protein